MFKYILPLLLISLSVDAQNSNKDYQENLSTIIDENNDLKKIIKDINSVFLRDIFQKKYIENKNYFSNTDLEQANEDSTQKVVKYNIIIKSLEIDEKEFKPFISKALAFNKNYLRLYSIRKEVLFQKYDSIKVQKALKDIDDLPTLEDINSKLNITKTKIRNYLENYHQRTCELKSKLEWLKSNVDQHASFKQNYDTLKNSDKFKTYPYLVKIIENVKNDVNNYSNNDLQPCKEAIK